MKMKAKLYFRDLSGKLRVLHMEVDNVEELTTELRAPQGMLAHHIQQTTIIQVTMPIMAIIK